MASHQKYEFVEDGTADLTQTSPIKILEGKYKDIVYRYGKISLEKLDSGDLKINMEVEVIKSPEGFDQKQDEFTKTVGDIFVNIVESGIETDDFKDLEADVHEDPVDNT